MGVYKELGWFLYKGSKNRREMWKESHGGEKKQERLREKKETIDKKTYQVIFQTF